MAASDEAHRVEQHPYEPPLYRPFALLAYGTAVLIGVPLGAWMLAWLYAGWAAVPVAWVLLHAYVQIFGFFATLIPGVAQHLFARFSGEPVAPTPLISRVWKVLAAALLLRLAGTALSMPALVMLAAALGALAFGFFGLWVWRSLAPPPLAPLRRHLAASTGWFVLALGFETALRIRGLTEGVPVPDRGLLWLVHMMALYGGVLGWVTRVLLRAGPMFVENWDVPLVVARAVPGALALGILITAAGEVGAWEPAAATVVVRLGEFVALGGAAMLLVAGGAFRRVRAAALPMIGRSRDEVRIFRIAALSAPAAVLGMALSAAAARAGVPVGPLTDAVRHLVTVGFLTSVVVAMTFRLIPVLEGRALPWPWLRHVAFGGLLAGVLLRTAEVLVGFGWAGIAPWIPLSGVLIWLALLAVAANLLGAIAARRATVCAS
jgi:hypothetical protein